VFNIGRNTGVTKCRNITIRIKNLSGNISLRKHLSVKRVTMKEINTNKLRRIIAEYSLFRCMIRLKK
jgi:hypothetical protein